MKTNILTIAIALSDQDLLARIEALAGSERQTAAELVAHLAALELRPSLYAAQGYGSLFDYCTQALRLSEDVACNRIQITRACRRFPVILDLLATGAVSLRSLRVLGPHLTAENHVAVLARAANRRRGDIDALVAELAPKPDVVASVRKVPVQKGTAPPSAPPTSPSPAAAGAEETAALVFDVPPDAAAFMVTSPPGPEVSTGGSTHASTPHIEAIGSLASVPSPQRPIIQASAPNRYRVQFTIGQESHDKLRRLQALLRREVPNGDPGILFERMLDAYLEKVEKAKLGETTRPRQFIRPGADKPSRHIPNAVRRVVWRRDGGQCAFVSGEGRRCGERAFLELHHIQPYALDGPATAANISLRCRRHNQYEAEVIFGPRGATSKQPVLPVDD